MSDYKCIVSFHTDGGSYFGYGSIIDYSRYMGLAPKYKKNFIENESYKSSGDKAGDNSYSTPSIDFGSDSSSSSSWDSGSSSSDSSSFDFGGGDAGGGGASGDW